MRHTLKVCADCHIEKMCMLRADAYSVEIRGDQTKRWLCGECAGKLQGEV